MVVDFMINYNKKNLESLANTMFDLYCAREDLTDTFIVEEVHDSVEHCWSVAFGRIKDRSYCLKAVWSSSEHVYNIVYYVNTDDYNARLDHKYTKLIYKKV